MMQGFKNMTKKTADTTTAYTRSRDHSPMSAKDKVLPERLTHDKIVKNFESFASREKFKNMPQWLRDLFYEGGAKIINNAIEEDEGE